MTEIPNKSLILAGRKYTDEKLKEVIRNTLFHSLLPAWERSLYGFVLDWINNETSLRIKTSGSTGPAKWIEIEKEKMIKSARLTGQFFNLQKNDKALLCLPVNFIAGKMMVIRAFVLGLDLIHVEPSSNPLKEINQSFDFAAMTPMQVFNTLKQSNGSQKLNQIKNLIIGGGGINVSIMSSIKDLTNNTFHTYGMTETMTHIALKKLNGEDSNQFFMALPGIKFNKDNRDCLVIEAPHLAEDKIVTNDIVELIDEQSFHFIGRIDNVINSGGIKIFPEKVEESLSSYMPNRFIIAGLHDDKLGQKVILIVEGEQNHNTDFKQIFDCALESKFERPKEIFYQEQFPETESGKIKRQQLVKLILQSTDYN